MDNTMAMQTLETARDAPEPASDLNFFNQSSSPFRSVDSLRQVAALAKVDNND